MANEHPEPTPNPDTELAADAAAEESGPSEIAQRLGRSQVGLRPELEVSRHVFRGRVSYVVRDPITFESHRFSQHDYEIVTALHAEHPLAEVFARLVDEEKLEADEEEAFYRFVISLHQLGFLHLPIPDGQRLYQRYLANEQQRRMKRWMAMFFYQLPLVNPDHFLDRTVRWVRPLFSPMALFLWCGLIASAIFVAVRRFDEISASVGDTFAAQNLPALWLTIIVLKFFHEFGHAYATKAFGGHVPEMGAYLIVFTPCAYVDASAAWGFSKKWHRMFVGLAGMYFELAIAAVALLAWAATGPGMMQSLLFNVVMLASVVTVGFNINPLMRFDGYYVLSDYLEFPNLRQRATDAITQVAKRIALGSQAPQTTEDSLRNQITLCSFGVFAALYRITVIVSISMLVASKFFLAGLVLAATYIALEIIKLLRRVLSFLWFSEEAKEAQVRSMAVSVILLFVGAYALFGVPLPAHVHTAGAIGTEGDRVVRAARAGFVTEVHAQQGRSIIVGEAIAELDDPSLLTELYEARSSLEVSELRKNAYATIDRSLAKQEEENVRYYRDRLTERERNLAELSFVADANGWVARCLPSSDVGRYLEAGEEVATIAAGRFTVVTYLNSDEIAAASPSIDDPVQFRPVGRPTERLRGTILRIEPVPSSRIDEEGLTQTGGGSIAIDPNTLRATQPLFRVVAVLDPSTFDGSLRHGQTGSIRFGAEPESVALILWRRVLVFLNRLDIG